MGKLAKGLFKNMKLTDSEGLKHQKMLDPNMEVARGTFGEFMKKTKKIQKTAAEVFGG